MKHCCPPGQGCNAPVGREEPCLLRRCQRSDSQDATRAVTLWKRFTGAQRAHRPGRERRFLRRAYARARDTAMPWRPEPVQAPSTEPEPTCRSERSLNIIPAVPWRAVADPSSTSRRSPTSRP